MSNTCNITFLIFANKKTSVKFVVACNEATDRAFPFLEAEVNTCEIPWFHFF